MFPTKSSSAGNVCLRAHLLLCASDSARKKFTGRLRLIELRPQFLVRLKAVGGRKCIEPRVRPG